MKESNISTVQIHFDGEYAANHQISLRNLSKALRHLQSAIDRAYLDNKYGYLWKHAKLPYDDYEEASFVTGIPKEGGFILDLASKFEPGKKALKRIAQAMDGVFQKMEYEMDETVKSLNSQHETKISQISNGILKPRTYADMLANPSEEQKRRFSDRSITKEIDQIVSPLRYEHSGESSFELAMKYDNINKKYYFDKDTSSRFHGIVASKGLSDPIIYQAKLLSLDSKNLSGKIHNEESKKESTIKLAHERDVKIVREYLGEPIIMIFVGCPLIEYGAIDTKAGDVYFMELLDAKPDQQGTTTLHQ